MRSHPAETWEETRADNREYCRDYVVEHWGPVVECYEAARGEELKARSVSADAITVEAAIRKAAQGGWSFKDLAEAAITAMGDATIRKNNAEHALVNSDKFKCPYCKMGLKGDCGYHCGTPQAEAVPDVNVNDLADQIILACLTGVSKGDLKGDLIKWLRPHLRTTEPVTVDIQKAAKGLSAYDGYENPSIHDIRRACICADAWGLKHVG